jgi:8-oxo-dGTP diphosphatase
MHKKPVKPAGVMIFLMWKNYYHLILRDDKPNIAFPNTWSPVTGGVEEDETYFQAIERELEEEIGVVPKHIKTLGVSAKGNCFFYGKLTDEEKEKIILGEGQKYNFFVYNWLKSCDIAGAFKIYLDKYPETFRRMSEELYEPIGSDFGLAHWDEDPQPDA